MNLNGSSTFDKWLWCLLLIVMVGFSGCTTSSLAPAGSVDMGPLYTTLPDAHGFEGVKALGPIYEQRVGPQGETFRAVRPFWSHASDPTTDRSVSDVLWPVGSFKHKHDELDWRFLLGYGHDFDTNDAQSRHRWAVFPLLFGGRSKTSQPYFSFFPLGGLIYDFLAQDEAWFWLFPLYLKSSQDEQETLSLLWPFFSRTQGGDVKRLRFWPFWGRVENEGRWRKQFVMWPFWTSVRYDYESQQGGGFVLFPLVGRVNLPDRQSWMLIPPFFKLEYNEQGHRAINAPWPIIQYARGDFDKLYLFPLAGRKSSKWEQSWFALWPIISHKTILRPQTLIERLVIAPFWYGEKRSPVREGAAIADGIAHGVPEVGDPVARSYKLWPLFMYRREDDRERFRTLSLWPLKETPAIERNWAPLWSLYERVRVGAHSYQELLWGVVRSRRSPDARRLSVFPFFDRHKNLQTGESQWRILYGLLGRRADAQHECTRWQIFYGLEFGGKGASAETGEQEKDNATP